MLLKAREQLNGVLHSVRIDIGYVVSVEHGNCGKCKTYGMNDDNVLFVISEFGVGKHSEKDGIKRVAHRCIKVGIATLGYKVKVYIHGNI